MEQDREPSVDTNQTTTPTSETTTGLRDLLEALASENITTNLDVNGFNKSYAESQEQTSSIVVQIIMFLGAVLAGTFFLLMLGIVGVFDSEMVLYVLGGILFLIGLAIPYGARQVAATEPLGMAGLFMGSILLGGAYLSGNGRWVSFLWVWLVLSAVVFVVSASKAQRFIAILTFNTFLCLLGFEEESLLFRMAGIVANALVITIGIVKETSILTAAPRLGPWYEAILSGCSISLVGLLIANADRAFFYGIEEGLVFYYQLLLLSFFIVLILWTLRDTLWRLEEEQKVMMFILGGTLLMLGATQRPGLVASVLFLLLGLFSSYRLLIALGMVSLVGFTTYFYYQFETIWSIILILALAAVLLGIIAYGLHQLHQEEINKIYEQK